MKDVDKLVRRYVELWNQTDPEIRHGEVAALWAETGAYVAGTGHFQGHDAVTRAVKDAHEEFIGAGFVFEPGEGPDTMGDSVRFTWNMVPKKGGAVAAKGFDFLILDEDGRIRTDYQYIDQQPA